MLHRQQEGGKLVGEGVYGCVFDKPLECVVKKEHGRHKYGKITDQNRATNEYTISERISSIPYAKDYFALIENYCVPKARKHQTEKDLFKCEVIENVPLTRMAQLVTPYGGKPLYGLPKFYRTIHYFSIAQHLLEAGTILLASKTVHFDLHDQNVLLNTPYSCKIVDYGESWSPESLTLSNLRKVTGREFAPAYSQTPPELSYVYGVIQNVSFPLLYAKMEDDMKVLDDVQTIWGITTQQQIKRLRTFVESSKTLQDENWLGFVKLYWHKMDAWAIGTLLIDLYLNMIYSDAEFEAVLESNPEFMKKINMLKYLVDMDAGKRYDCAELLAKWAPDSKLLKLPEVKEWLKEQAKIRKALQ